MKKSDMGAKLTWKKQKELDEKMKAQAEQLDKELLEVMKKQDAMHRSYQQGMEQIASFEKSIAFAKDNIINTINRKWNMIQLESTQLPPMLHMDEAEHASRQQQRLPSISALNFPASRPPPPTGNRSLSANAIAGPSRRRANQSTTEASEEEDRQTFARNIATNTAAVRGIAPSPQTILAMAHGERLFDLNVLLPHHSSVVPAMIHTNTHDHPSAMWRIKEKSSDGAGDSKSNGKSGNSDANDSDGANGPLPPAPPSPTLFTGILPRSDDDMNIDEDNRTDELDVEDYINFSQ